ncbi:MAG TPA: amylo-alpha-1,6-glucosidase [Opitutales bacterium]|jgi:predicted glycogen debranching enzyme|nr:amylo-alpha-1,6-glucosidase [Opitutales bacterium]
MALPLSFSAAELAQADRLRSYEWLETNGLGGWASSTISNAHTRRYHGLLVAALQPPGGRMVLLSKLEETLHCAGGTYDLGCNQYPGVVAPCGFQYVESFSLLPFPTWRYRAGPLVLEKQIGAIHGENTTVIQYKLLSAPGPVELLLRPMVAVRGYHALQHANNDIHREAPFANGVLTIRAYDGTPSFYISVPEAAFDYAPFWYYHFQYREEQARGLDFDEDLFSHGALRVTLNLGQTLGVIVSLNSPAGRDTTALLAVEAARREAVVTTAGFTGEVERQLVRAADQFIVRRGENLHTIIAGYHWFGDWGRDTMISLPGLCLATKRFSEAKEILRAFAQAESGGMLPNNFSDDGGAPAYNTADAALWFFVAVRAYLLATNDEVFVRDEILPVLEDILVWHDKGTRHNIHCGDDGLLFAGEPGVQVTWMDAKVGDWVVTPRIGQAVEINALWYNALAILAELRARFARPGADDLAARAFAVKDKFCETFWNSKGGYLYDVVNGSDRDDSLRPNQLFALSLPHELLPNSQALRVLKTVEQRLLTPVGLRSLAPGSPGYRPRYEGNVHSRDGAYHQGTVWGWLLGPYITALVRLRGASGRERARSLVDGLRERLSEAGLGTLSEIYDAEMPNTPRGCIAQAWSVAEILRAAREDLGA